MKNKELLIEIYFDIKKIGKRRMKSKIENSLKKGTKDSITFCLKGRKIFNQERERKKLKKLSENLHQQY